jgi:hypothetical protein
MSLVGRTDGRIIFSLAVYFNPYDRTFLSRLGGRL